MAKKKELKAEEPAKEEKVVEETPTEEVKKEETPVEEKKEEVKEPKKKEKKPKNKLAIVLGVIIVVLLLVIGCLIFFILKPKDDGKSGQNTEIAENDEKDDGLYPPSKADIVNYTEMNNGGGGGIYLHCMLEGTLDYADKTALNSGDIVECTPGVEVYNEFKIDTLYFQLDYGEELEYLGTTKVDEEYVKVEKNRTRLNIKKPSSVIEPGYAYRFKVKEDATTEGLYVSLKDVVFRTSTKKYYSIQDYETKFSIKSSVYYIYRHDSSKAINVFASLINSEYQTLVGKYTCSSKECTDGYSSSGNYVLFKDPGYVAYNYKTEEKVDLSRFDEYDDVEIVADTKLIGAILGKNGKNDSYLEGYYSIDAKKFIVPMSANNFIYENDGYISASENGKTRFMDYYGKELVPTVDMMERVEGTDFYFIRGFEGMDACSYYFYTKDGKKLFNGKGFFESFDIAYSKTKDGNLVLKDGKKYVIYDINEKVLYESAAYNELSLAGDYVIVLDSENNLRVIDFQEQEIVNFGKMKKDVYIHWALSGYYDYNGKTGIYVVVEDESATIEELKKDAEYENAEEFDDMYEYEDRGYEYYYIPATGESGKFATFIGGYAKPVLYLYPEADNTKVTVTFEKPWLLTTTYPKYNKSWKVTADKNGDLHDANGKYYYGLYWEEEGSTNVDFSEGFYVTKDNAIEFLEEKLTTIGLNDRERNEFIMYWLPILEKNGKSLVYFELTEERNEFNKLNISPAPDSLLRVAIHVKKVDKKTKIKEQKLTTFERKGFTAVEWGGVIH